ncbi:MAG: hypothetical protein OEY89_12060 [Gammaproteobacteria bacterium]|nr:hypothetical protein [Gammaproteobacteria bacterium]
MSILTSKMKTARSDHYGSNLKLWYPCDDAGNTMSERIVGADIPDDAASEHDIPHALGMGTTANISIPNLANVNIPKQGMALVVANVSISYATISLSIGNFGAGVGLSLSGAGCGIRNSVGFVSGVTGATGPVAGNPIILSMAWDTSNMYTYVGENADAVLVDTDAISAAISAGLPAALSPVATINGTSSEADIYGIALFDFTTDGLPSDLLAGINWMKDSWLAGHKEIYSGWKSRN